MKMRGEIEKILEKCRPKSRALLRMQYFLSKAEMIAQWKAHIWPHLEYGQGILEMACKTQLARLDSFQRGFLNELEISEETAFLEHNFAPPALRRRIGLLGFAHKVALGDCHPRLPELLPSTKEPSGTKVFQLFKESIVYFEETLYSKSLYGALQYYNSIPSALRKAPSVKSFQSDLTNEVRRLVRDSNPRWRKAFDFSESWIIHGGTLD